MHQSHFLLSVAAGGLSLRHVIALSEAEAFELLREVRWGRYGDPVCPSCGAVDRHWFLRSRRQRRCRACGHSQAYRAEGGTNTHQAESFHGRFQRTYVGQHHHFGLGYLANYANEIA